MSYLLPNEIKVYESLENILFSFRVKKPISRAEILFKDENDNVIKKFNKADLLPSEMVQLNVNNLPLNEINQLKVEVRAL